MTNTATKTYLVGVIERAIAYYLVEAENARTAADNWQDGQFHDRDDEALESEGPCNVRVRQPDGTWLKLPPSKWETESSAALGAKPYAIATATETCPPSDPDGELLIIRSGETAAAERIIVPADSPLIAGKVYLQLYHGRKDPSEDMDDWGFVGPTFGPLTSVVQTYLTHFRLYGNDGMELWLETRDDMIVWQGSYYGDMSIFIAGRDSRG